MRICIEQFLGQNHSWSIVGQNLARSFIRLGHSVDLKSTNGYDLFPEDLKSFVKEKLKNDYDAQVSYTAMKNFPVYLSHGNKNRFGIWNYETTVLPYGFAKYYKFTDRLLPSSHFSAKIFVDNGIPASHISVVPHGVDEQVFSKVDNIFKLKTEKKVKILTNIAQPHIRKNIPGLLESFGLAFTKKDDVCLIIKLSKKTKDMTFDISFDKIFCDFQKKFPNHAEIEVVTDFLPNIAELYHAVDAVFSMAHAECFYLPGLESMAAGKITIAPRYGGQLDFMNNNNSLLIDGKVVRSPKEMQYWLTSPFAAMFEPDVESAAEQLKVILTKTDELKKMFQEPMKKTVKEFSWENAAKKILNLCIMDECEKT